MELDDLKNSWKKIAEQQPIKGDQIRELMRNTSRSPLVKLRKSMFLEAFFMLLSMAVIYILYFSTEYNTSSLALFGLGLLTALWLFISIYFYSRVYKTSTFNESAPVSESLLQKINSLESDITLYKNINLIAYIPALLIGILLGNKSLTSLEVIANSPIQIWGFILIIALLFFPLYYMFVKWWVQKFYGKYLDELKAMHKEIYSAE